MCSDETRLTWSSQSHLSALQSSQTLQSAPSRKEGLWRPSLVCIILKNFFFLSLNLKLSYNFDSVLCTLHMCGVLANAEAFCEFQKRQAHGKGRRGGKGRSLRRGPLEPPASHLRCPRLIESIFLQSWERLTPCCKQMRARPGRKLRNGLPGGD